MSRFYLTTPIYYVNDVPHIGHAYTTVNADAIVRWHRLRGDDVFFLTGTDEHGLKVAQAAEAHGISPLELATRNAERFRVAWAELGISNDDFIRTTEPRHHRAAQAFLQAIYDNGHIELGTYEGLYCVACEAYYNPDELVDGNCPIHATPVQPMKEQNYFFRLSSFEKPLLDWYDAHPDAVVPASRRNEALGFIRQGLQDVSITRTSLKWGVPVPWDPAHVFYVWYDALINYATAVGYGAEPERFALWWPAVRHLIGKDIARFHCVWWPAMCMAAGVEPPRQFLVHGWLLVGGQKMSKSRLNQIFPSDLIADFGVDAVRYHLLRDTALGSDGDFSYEGMVARYNADLANNLGNLFSRVATVVASKCEGIGPAPTSTGHGAAAPNGGPGQVARGSSGGAGSEDVSRLAAVATREAAAALEAWDRFASQEALEAAWRLIRETNAELEAREPWKAEPGPAVQSVLGDALEALRIVVLVAFPAMPVACGELWRRLGLSGSPSDQRVPAALAWGGYPGGLRVERGAPLFPRRRR